MSNNDLQQQLLEAIFFTDKVINPALNLSSDDAGLAIYRQNLKATASQALSITFPTIYQLIGEQFMQTASEELLIVEPPKHGDWAKWGKGFGQVLASYQALQNYPFLSDSADLDYHCHQLVRANDNIFNQDSLSLLASENVDNIYVHLMPSLVMMTSQYPIVDIRAAHQLPPEERKQALVNIANAEQQSRYYIIAFRLGVEVFVRHVSEQEYHWLQLLKQYSLGEALSRVDLTTFSFEDWLVKSLQNSLLLQFSLEQA